jgi:pimeloyl-ACP methyl ester carboxylesterase
MGARAMMAAPVAGNSRIRRSAVDVAGGLLRLTVAGDGPALILLHGWTLDARMWQPQIAGLARAFTLVMPDRRGFGRSSAPPDLTREAEDIARIADVLKLERFGLVGLSQGASVALDAAGRLGPRVAALAVCGAPLPALVERAEALDLAHYQRLAGAGDLAAMRAAWATHPLMQAQTRTAREALAAMLADYDGRDLLAPSGLPDLTCESVAALPMPILALAGEHDTPWRRACAAALAEAAPHGRYALVEGAGHVANLDNPARFDACLSDFFHTATQQGPSA